MVIGERLKDLREAKKLSQGDIEKRTGLIRCYTSRVENGHTVPTIETLGKYAMHWKFRSTNSSTKERSLPKYPVSPKVVLMTIAGEVPARLHESCSSFDGS